tara:strand:- start:75 stop:422 length:348 start_codon:yes stop_codon:yes gene_type:complete
MALTESIEYDKIEVVGIYKSVQVRKATVIKRDNVEIAGSRSFERYTLQSGTLKGGVKADGVTPADDADDFVDNPLDKEPDGVTAIPDEVKNVCNAVWTSDVKALYKARLIADKSS